MGAHHVPTHRHSGSREHRHRGPSGGLARAVIDAANAGAQGAPGKAETTWLDHAGHGDWVGDGSAVRCVCGAELWRSAEVVTMGHRERRSAAKALMRAERAIAQGYRPSDKARQRVEGADHERR